MSDGCARMTAVRRCAVDDGPDAVLAALDPEQREVALAARGPVCVIAGAGTGKTRAIAHRVAYAVRVGLVNPGHVLAVTFTTRAAGELRGRLRELGGPSGSGLDRVVARTFHSAALRQLVHFWPHTVGGRPPAVLDSKIGLLAEAARAARVPASGPELRDLATEVEWAKVMQVRPEDYPGVAVGHRRAPPVEPEAAGRVFAAYEQLRRDRHLVDFESVLELTAAILGGHRGAGAEVRDRYRYFVVDEYQDVNPLQKLLLDAWLGDRDDLCVVGDPRQTIYSFTGATSAYLTGFAAEYPHATVVQLVRNYRSTPEVVGCANRLAEADGQRGRGALTGPALVAQRAGGRVHRVRRRGGGGGGRGGPGPAVDGCRGTAAPDGRAGPGQRAHRAVRARVRRRGRALPGARRRAVLRPARGAAGDRAAAHGGQERARGGGRGRARRPAGHRGGGGRGGAAHPRRGRAHPWASVRPGGRPGPLGVAGGAGPAGRGSLCRRSRGGPRRHCRRTGPPGRGRARPAGGRGDRGVAARGQGAGMGRGLPAGPDRGQRADHSRRDQRGGGGGTPAAVCRGDPGPAAGPAVLGAGPGTGRRPRSHAVPVPDRNAARPPRGTGRPDGGVPAYVVFPDETLWSIAAQRPASREGLARIPGLGPGRLDRYGAAVLALCAEAPARAGADDKKAGSRA